MKSQYLFIMKIFFRLNTVLLLPPKYHTESILKCYVWKSLLFFKVWKNILAYRSLKLRLKCNVIAKVHRNCTSFSHESYEKNCFKINSVRGISINQHQSSNCILLNFAGVFLYIFPSYILSYTSDVYLCWWGETVPEPNCNNYSFTYNYLWYKLTSRWS